MSSLCGGLARCLLGVTGIRVWCCRVRRQRGGSGAARRWRRRRALLLLSRVEVELAVVRLPLLYGQHLRPTPAFMWPVHGTRGVSQEGAGTQRLSRLDQVALEDVVHLRPTTVEMRGNTTASGQMDEGGHHA